MNVAITRARHHLIIVGRVRALTGQTGAKEGVRMWTTLLDQADAVAGQARGHALESFFSASAADGVGSSVLVKQPLARTARKRAGDADGYPSDDDTALSLVLASRVDRGDTGGDAAHVVMAADTDFDAEYAEELDML